MSNLEFLEAEDDFELLLKFEKIIKWWIGLDENPPVPDSECENQKVELTDQSNVFALYQKFMNQYPQVNLSDGFCDWICIKLDDIDLDMYEVPRSQQRDFLPVFIYNTDVDIGTLVGIFSSISPVQLHSFRNGVHEKWPGSLGQLLVSHGLTCLISKPYELKFSNQQSKFDLKLIHRSCYGSNGSEFFADKRGVLLKTLQYPESKVVDGIVRTRKICEELGVVIDS